MPPAYTTQQKAAISEFVAFTRTDRTQAARHLKAAQWNVQAACLSYYNQSGSHDSPYASALGSLFEKYRSMGQDSEKMDLTATQHYFKDIGVNLEDVSCFLALAVVNCMSIGEISKEGFVDGWSNQKCDSIVKQKQFITANKNTLGIPQNASLLETVYKHTFDLLLQSGQRSAEKSTCIDSWRILLSAPAFDWSSPSFNWLDEWIRFIDGPSSVKGISRDQWNHVLKFAKLTQNDENLSFHSEEQSWPALIDEFVTHVKEVRGIVKGTEEDVDMDY